MKSVKTFVQEQQKKYVKGWQNDPNEILNKGLYEWMVAQINSNHNIILEVGCGVGNSTLSLLNAGKRVISIDENYYCIEETYKKLIDNGFKVFKINDRLDKKLDGDFYKTVIKDKKLPDPKIFFEEYECLLLQSDILQDYDLNNFSKLCDVQTIICWLIGTHSAKAFDSNLGSGIKTPMEYRLKVQNTVYEIADDILKQGGILNIIDRGLYLNEQDQQNLIINHKDQASVTALKVTDKIVQKKLGLPASNGVGMVEQNSQDTEIKKSEQELWLHSVNSYK